MRKFLLPLICIAGLLMNSLNIQANHIDLDAIEWQAFARREWEFLKYKLKERSITQCFTTAYKSSNYKWALGSALYFGLITSVTLDHFAKTRDKKRLGSRNRFTFSRHCNHLIFDAL
jgi:hypothetical protein